MNEVVNDHAESTAASVAPTPAANQMVDSSVDETKEFVKGFFGEEGEKEDGVEPVEAPEKEVEADESDESPENGPSEDQQPKNKGYERRKEQLSEDIRGLVSRRQELADQISKLEHVVEAQANIDSGMISPEDLEALGLSREEALYQASQLNYKAMSDQRALDQYKAEIESLNHHLEVDRVELLRDYPIFDAESDKYNQEFTEKALEMYGQFANLQYDDSGMVTGVSAKLYDFMSALASLSEIQVEAAKSKARKDMQKTIAGVSPIGADNAPSVDETKAFVDDFFKY